jgi:hypothetical protein
MQVRQLKTIMRNESVFREYRRFDTSSAIQCGIQRSQVIEKPPPRSALTS